MESIKEVNVKSARIRQRAKALLVFSLFTAISTGMAAHAYAQTFSEWFAQKKTQKKYLLQQIAALQLYSGYLKKGYGIATNGLGSVSGYLDSENSLHHTYYDRLRTAAPVVKNNTLTKEIMNRQQDILKSVQDIDEINGMTRAEKEYLASVCTTVLNDCDQQLNTLQNVVNDNQAAMSDAERLTQVSKVHAAMQANYRFISGFVAEVKILNVRRRQEHQQAIASKRIYGIH